MELNTIITSDCLDVLPTLPAVVVADLVVVDPQFNNGTKYPSGRSDNLPTDVYLSALEARLRACRRVLSPTGSIVVAISQRLLFRVGLLLEDLGFHWRNTIIWHYTFGQCQRRKFTPSYTPLLHFTMDPDQF